MERENWMQTASGLAIDPLDPRPHQIKFVDIASALSKLCRFNGHCREFYSVAQHSVIVSRHCPTKPLAGLLHDMAEAYVSDMPRPLKRQIFGYAEAEDRMLAACAESIGVNLADLYCDEVKHADLIALATEKRDLMGPEPAPWMQLPEPAIETIVPLGPETAFALFHRRFKELTQ